jgi:hypothetical protein
VPEILRRTLAATTSVAAALLLHPAGAAADPIVITSGLLEADVRLGDVRIVGMRGDGLEIDTVIEGNFRSDLQSCLPCETESPIVALSGTFPGGGVAGGGGGMVDGVSYPQLYFFFEGGSISTPGVQLSGSGPSVVSVPFTFQATMNFYLVNPFVGPNIPDFTRELRGSGVASAAFRSFADDDGRLVHNSDGPVRYTFESGEPVPEPATWLLVSAGVLTWSAGRRTRRAHRA